jgi:hypothetical protein
MQKVVGSSPIIRSRKAPSKRGFLLSPLPESATREPVGCANSVSRGEALFVDESAEAVAALDVGR